MNGIASPGYMANYRRQTDGHASMAGVTHVQKRFRYISCEKLRTEATGKHTKKGFVCHGCGRSA